MNQTSLANKRVAEIADPAQRRATAALRAAKIGVFEFEPLTNLAFWDDRVRELWGIKNQEIITYETVVAHVHPDDRKMHDESTAKALDPEGNGHMDLIYRLFPKDGHPMRWLHAKADCFFENGHAVKLVGTVEDITIERETQEQNKLLLNELEHRVKNTLATAVAIVSLSRAGVEDIDAYFKAVDERLRSLATSQDLLRQTDWTSVSFEKLLERSAQSFLDMDGDKVNLVGDELFIPAKHVMSMSMGVHELLTNAAKYGALSVPSGGIEINVTKSASSKTMTMTWVEVGGPTPRTTGMSGKGFGSILLKEILPMELNGTATLDLEQSGLRYSLTMPQFER